MNPVLTFVLAIMFCLALAFAVERLIDGLAVTFWPLPRHRRRWPPAGVRPLSHRAVTIIVTGLVVAIILFCSVMARAHDNPTDWIGKERRQNAKNEYCCGEGDCHPIPMREIIMTPGGYRLPSGDVIPFDKAAPSADEFFWTCEWGGERKCAFAPLGGS